MPELRARATALVAQYPTLPLALRAALAAVGAWLLLLPLGGIADDYPYYAPLGAVVAVSTTVAMSIRAAFQTATTLLVGAALGVAGLVAPIPTPVALGAVVGVGTLVAAWPWLGQMGIWVPISALFVLILGDGDAWHFVPAYLGLTTLGAVFGAALNATAPPLHFAAIRQAQERLRSAVVDQLQQLADGIDGDEPPTTEDWESRRLDMAPLAQQVTTLATEATREPPVNWRARRWRTMADRLHGQGRALVALAFLVGDLTTFMAHRERADRGQVPLGPSLRPAAVRALRSAAAALHSVDGEIAEQEEFRRAWGDARELASQIHDLQQRTGGDYFAAGTLYTSLERTLLSVAPTDDAVV